MARLLRRGLLGFAAVALLALVAGLVLAAAPMPPRPEGDRDVFGFAALAGLVVLGILGVRAFDGRQGVRRPLGTRMAGLLGGHHRIMQAQAQLGELGQGGQGR